MEKRFTVRSPMIFLRQTTSSVISEAKAASKLHKTNKFVK